MDHNLGHKAGLDKYKKTEIILYVLSDLKNKTRNRQQKVRKYLNTQRINNALLNTSAFTKK
jgi:formylmethanofuran dehydrogenase subunit B